MRLSPHHAAIGALILSPLFWSGNFITGRVIAGQIGPLELNMLRWILCLAMLLPFTARRMWRERAALRRSWRLITLLGLTGIASFHSLTYLALSMTDAINCLLLLAVAPVATALGGSIWDGYRPPPWTIAGFALSVVGAVILLLGGGAAEGVGRGGFDRGMAWMLLAVLIWAAYTLMLRRRPADLSQSVALTASIGVAIAAMALLLAVIGWQPVTFTPGIVAAVLYIAVFASLLGFLFWSYGVSVIGPERSGQFLHLMPLFGSVMAITVLGEALALHHIVGGGLIVLGIGLVNRR